MDSLSSEVRLRLEGSVENLNALDIEIKEKIINQVQDIIEKVKKIEGEIASFETMINMLLEDNELKYWLRDRDVYQRTFDSTSEQYEDAIRKNKNWYKEMQERGFTEEQIKNYDNEFNTNLNSLRNTLNVATENLNRAQVELEKIGLFAQYEKLKKQIQLSKDKFKNLKYVFVVNKVAKVKLNKLISDVKENEKWKKRARDFKMPSKEDFIRSIKRPKPQKLLL